MEPSECAHPGLPCIRRELIWTWAAEADRQRFYAYAMDHAEGSGVQLLLKIEKVAALLLCFPMMAAQRWYSVRRLILRHRQLDLFYAPEPRGIVIIGVADLRGDPDNLWSELQGRLPCPTPGVYKLCASLLLRGIKTPRAFAVLLCIGIFGNRL